MATAGSVTLTTAIATVFESSKGCTELTVQNLAASANTALINIEGLHDTSDFFIVEKGQVVTFRLLHQGIKKMTAKSSATTALLTFGVTSITAPSN